ncbi:uncharacterized protein LOC132611254 [Lycium barbarum]|uniref:uncharacterized protein LOC132611254 n=1 Tax=Lycium barbarum TaxID=112863 RepID=UPI00293E9476|nr:uncharacterized protein LOC132611254 [Lycium barbarum]
MSDSPSSVAGVPCTPTTPSTPDISIGSTSGSSTSSRLVISIVGEKFVPNGHSISKSITETFKERQDATGYSWKDVSESTRKFYWHEFVKLYQWNPSETTVIEHAWVKVASTLYSKKLHHWRKRPRLTFVPEDVWKSWKTYWAFDKWLEKSHIDTQNRHSETGGLDTGPSKHTGGSKSTAIDLRRPANSWDVFKKLHTKERMAALFIPSLRALIYWFTRPVCNHYSQIANISPEPSAHEKSSLCADFPVS